ncbi:uncharacterized protein JCM6883_001110 [Sporobolomyces salmoneus]|uniref:uncharacterized protein n=1 Tax=Sporobolomyces salmoneus TaxID=183962 RepID=UPI0031745D62
MVPRPTKKTKTSHTESKKEEPVKATPGGDDLEDNLLLDDQYLSDGPADNDDDTVEGYLSPDDEQLPAAGSKKRSARTTASGSENEEIPPSTSTSTSSSKKAKKDKSKSKKKAKLEELGLDETTKDDTALLPLEVALDRLSEKQKKALPTLSGLELDEMRLNQSMIQDTSTVTTRDDLLEFMKAALPTACTTLAKLPKAHGSPRIIVLSGAALRVADLCRQVKTFRTKQKDGNVIDVGKLFAKHFKLNEHAEYLQKTYVGIAVGTPNRIEKLLNETDSLKLTHLSHLILDTTHLDAKKRSLMDLPDARGDLFKLLGCGKVMERLREGKMKVVLF